METYRLWWEEIARLLPLALLIWLTCILVIRWSVFASIVRMTEWIRRARRGETMPQDSLPKGNLFAPLTREVTQMARSLTAARAGHPAEPSEVSGGVP